MSTKDLITREIKAVQQRIRGRVVTEPRQSNFDPSGAQFLTWLVDVDIGGDQILVGVPVKINGPKARSYARAGSPVWLEKDAQGRYQVVSPADRAPQQGNLILVDEDADTTSSATFGYQVVREPFIFYKGTTPESFFDPSLDANTLVWLRAYDRLAGLPNNIVVASDVDGAQITQISDKSGNGIHAQQDGNNPFYRKFDATGGNSNKRSSADFDGVNDVLDFASNINETVGGDISIFIMLNKDSIGGGDDVILQTDDWRIYSRRAAGDTWGFDQGGGVQNSTDQIGANFKLIELVANGFADVDLYADGTFLANFTPGGSGLSTGSSHLGNTNAGTATHNGRIIELLILDETVTATKRQAIEAYFNQTMFVAYSKWNNSVDGFPKIRVFDADGNEVSL